MQKQVLKNMEFVDKLREASSITGRISEAEAMTVSSKQTIRPLINEKKRLSEIKQELNDLTSSYIYHKYTKEGASENQYHRPMAGNKRYYTRKPKLNYRLYRMQAVN